MIILDDVMAGNAAITSERSAGFDCCADQHRQPGARYDGAEIDMRKIATCALVIDPC
jgi:hypothetical protein